MTMMDALSAPRGSTPDMGLARSGVAGRGDTQGEGGFSKVMSSTGRQGGQGGEKADQQGAEELGGEGEGSVAGKAVEHGAGEKATKPIIDISAALVRENGSPLTAFQEAQAGQVKPVHEKAGKAGAKPADTQAEATKDKGTVDLRGALAEAVDLRGELEADEQSDAEVKTPGEQTRHANGVGDALQLLAAIGVDGAAGQPNRDMQEKTPGQIGALADSVTGAGHLSAKVSANAHTGDEQPGDRGSSDDKSFRFVRADGKGEPLVIQPSDKAAVVADEAAPVETVTVIDSRRIIAPASTSNGANITAVMLGDSEWLTAMQPGSELANAASHSSQGRVVHTLKIQMTPIELGSVTATLKLVGEELSVQLTVDNHAALRQLQADQSDMLSALKAQGLTVDQVQVTLQLAPGDKSAGSGQDGASSQQFGQQAQQSGGQSGNQERRSAPLNQTGQTDDRGAQEISAPSSSTSGSRPDQLYL